MCLRIMPCGGRPTRRAAQALVVLEGSLNSSHAHGCGGVRTCGMRTDTPEAPPGARQIHLEPGASRMPTTGTRVGPYEIVRIAGAGGMGQVYGHATRASTGTSRSRRCPSTRTRIPSRSRASGARRVRRPQHQPLHRHGWVADVKLARVGLCTRQSARMRRRAPLLMRRSPNAAEPVFGPLGVMWVEGVAGRPDGSPEGRL
jgi:hypothetical protein